MNKTNCLHPVRVRLHDGSFSYMPCGKCEVCLNRRSQDWVHRLQRESECWRYTFFVSLTYDDSNLPYGVLQDNQLVDVSNGLVLADNLTTSERLYISKQKKVSYPNVRDVQLFIKRLRYYYNEYKKTIKSHNRTLRYFLAFEYGPTTHRIHLHGLFFFTDEESKFAVNFQTYLDKSWQNGFTSSSIVQSQSAASYVAKYCNSPVGRRGLYSRPSLRVRSLFSKNPPLGSLQFNDEVCKSIVRNSSVEVDVCFKDSVKSLALPSYLRSKLFPKITGFSRFSDTELFSLYSISRWSNFSSAKELIDFIQNDLDPLFYFNSKSVWTHLVSLIDFSKKDPLAGINRLWRISCRLSVQADIFNISFRDYFNCLLKYWQNVEFLKLKRWYEAQDSLQRVTPKVPLSSWLEIDPDFMNRVRSFVWQSNNVMDFGLFYTLEGYGLDPIKFLHSSRVLPSDPHKNAYISNIHRMYEDSHKVKAKKDYLYLHSNYVEALKIYEKYF